MKNISKSLINWYLDHRRELPWRKSKDPYHIWLSEIILQQTRVNQGLPYFVKFTDKYPNIELLAEAKLDDILKLWQGLGYYSRARNLHHCAQQVCTEFKGIFPSAKNELLKLKGVGDYTASAISSMAFDQKALTLDGNVYRVLSRLFDIDLPIDVRKSRDHFNAMGLELMAQHPPGDFNQALMEFGALQCLPQSPNCGGCCLNGHCMALRKDKVSELPVKRGKVKVESLWMRFFVIHDTKKMLVTQRSSKGMWGGLFEFIKQETSKKPNWEHDPCSNLPSLCDKADRITLLMETTHKLTHRNIRAQFIEVRLPNLDAVGKIASQKVTPKEFESLAIHRLMDKFWEDSERGKFLTT